MHVHDFRPIGAMKPRPAVTTKIKAGDTVTWKNPNTGVAYPGLTVLHVNKTSGAALLSGWFGRLGRSGANHIEQKGARLEQLTVEA